MKVTCDSNAVVYAFADFRDMRKTEAARFLLGSLFEHPGFFISTQTLKEFANASQRKVKPPLPRVELMNRLQELAQLEVFVVDVPVILAAAELHFEHQVSYYDALQIEAARAGGASVLYSKDTQHDRTYGGVRVINPFL